MNNVIPLQNSPERVSLLPIAPGVDFATALSLRRMATSTGATPAYLPDETMRNWLKQAVKRAEADGVHFSIPVTPHTFRHSYIMHMLYHRQPRKVIQALAGHRDPRSMEVYTRVFALDMAATLAVPFTGDGRDAAEILRTLPPLK